MNVFLKGAFELCGWMYHPNIYIKSQKINLVERSNGRQIASTSVDDVAIIVQLNMKWWVENWCRRLKAWHVRKFGN